MEPGSRERCGTRSLPGVMRLPVLGIVAERAGWVDPQTSVRSHAAVPSISV